MTLVVYEEGSGWLVAVMRAGIFTEYPVIIFLYLES